MERPTEQQIAAWHGRLFRTALRLTRTRADAEDLTQDAFCKAWQNWDQFDGRCQPVTWIYRILTNCAVDWARSEAVRRNLAPQGWDLLLEVPAENPSGDVEGDGAGPHERLRLAIAALPPTLRRPFIAAVVDGYSYLEVAEMLDLSAGVVANRIFRARKELAAAMRRSSPET